MQCSLCLLILAGIPAHATSLPAGERLVSEQDVSDSKPHVDQGELPRVLILGDSISIGYMAAVREGLKGKALVYRPTNPKGGAENCAGTEKGIQSIDRWLKIEGGEWDVIHFNFGLHDLKRVDPITRKNSARANDPRQSEPENYRKQLEEIVGKLKRTGAELVFATTTPVPEGDVRPHRDVLDPPRYNRIAVDIMNSEGIQVNDLFKYAKPRLGSIQRKANVHFTKQGSKELGQQVVVAIEKALAKRSSIR